MRSSLSHRSCRSYQNYSQKACGTRACWYHHSRWEVCAIFQCFFRVTTVKVLSGRSILIFGRFNIFLIQLAVRSIIAYATAPLEKSRSKAVVCWKKGSLSSYMAGGQKKHSFTLLPIDLYVHILHISLQIKISIIITKKDLQIFQMLIMLEYIHLVFNRKII